MMVGYNLYLIDPEGCEDPFFLRLSYASYKDALRAKEILETVYVHGTVEIDTRATDRNPGEAGHAPEPHRPYRPKTGQPCSCRPGQQRDNCPACEGTGQRIDFAAIRARTRAVDRNPGMHAPFKTLEGRWAAGEVKVHTWFERDRSHVEIRDEASDETLIEWWDEDVQQLFEDGFLVARRGDKRLEASAIEYATHLGVHPYPKSFRQRRRAP